MSGRSPRKAAAVPQPQTVTEPTGGSKTWSAAKDNHKRIGNLFLESMAQTNPPEAARWGAAWDSVPEEEVCTRLFFGHGATYLTDGYVIADGHKNAGQHLDQGPAEAVWLAWLQDVKRRFEGSTRPETIVRQTLERALCLRSRLRPARALTALSLAVLLLSCCRLLVQAFLRCVTDESSEGHEWKVGTKRQMGRKIFHRKLHEEKGEMSNVEHEIFLKHVKALCAALARADTKEAATRKA